MVATRSLFAATFLLFASLTAASPAASKTSSTTKSVSKTTTTKSSTKTSTTKTSAKTTTTKKATTTKASVKASTTTTTTASTPACSPEAQGIISPTDGATIVQVNDGNYGPTYVEIIYCSGQYFKTSSIDGSVWLTFPDTSSGQLLIKDQQPDNLDADAGFYSYRFNASITPSDGDYPTGPYTLSVYETATGYYNPLNYEITSINVTLTVEST